MSTLASQPTFLKSNRKRGNRLATGRERYLEALEPRQLLSGVVTNPPPVQTYYMPFPAASVLQALQTIHSGPKSTVSTYTSIAVAEDNTLVYYDQWENGFVSDISNPSPADVYNIVTNPAGVQIWGDGDPSNGSAPGFPSDVLHGGDVIELDSPSITVPRNPSQIYFDGGDKIAVSKSVSIGELNWASGTLTLLAGALQVDPVSAWGTNYTVPVGQNTTGANSMFKYTGLTIMAQKDGTTVQIDTDGNGKIDKTVTLNQGQSYLVNNGVKQGAKVMSTDPTKPIEVDVITGNPGQTYASRWFNLAPSTSWSSSYYTPVSTRSSNATAVFLYNPLSTAITVTEQTRGASGTAATLTTTMITVPAKGAAKVTMPEGSGAHFFTATGQTFYAVSTSDFGSYNYDWGMNLIPDNQLTTQALVGLGFGRDPTSTVNPAENGSPVFVTPTGNGNAPVTVYVDYNGDNSGPLTDPNGYHYDVALSLAELQTAKVFDPDGNQSGMLLYTLDPNVKLAVSWGEDPASASIASPGIDAGTNIEPLQEYDAGKSATLLVDANGDGVVSPGDTLQYTIVVNNISRATLSSLQLTDNLPTTLSYIDNTASYTITSHDGTASSPVLVVDSGSTLFPLDESGMTLPTLAGGSTFTLTFDAKIGDVLPAGLTDLINTGSVAAPKLNENVPIQSDTPVKYDVTGLVFQDTNRNGVLETGEPGMAGVMVNLLSGSSVVATATTDASGHYRFIGVSLGTYTVDVVDSSVEAVLPNSLQTAGVDPSLVTVTGGAANTDAGSDGYMTIFVAAPPSTLGGRVTVNGVGVGGVAITLTGTTDDGDATTPVTVNTAADGTYVFLDVVAGNYTLSESQPSGLLDGPDSAGNVGGTVSPIPGDQISNISLPSGVSAVNYNFTEINPASASGFVYIDANNNGIKDNGELPVGGVVLTLTGTNDLSIVAPITVTTAADGSYSFANLRPGTYAITETQPGGYFDGLDTKGGSVIAGSKNTDMINGLTLAGGANSLNDNFGELLPVTVNGCVYSDSNNNGVKDAGELPISGATITLTGSNDLGAITPITVITAANGSYSFGNLRPGNYSVRETQPAGYLDGLDAKSGVVIANSKTTDTITGIALAEGTTAGNNNFGDLLPANAGGFVYADANNNGIKDPGELAISGVSLTLTGTNDLGTITPVTITSGVDGSYSFGTLRPGTYTITETQPAKYLDGLDANGGVVIAGSNTTDLISGIMLTAGISSSSDNFGDLPPACVKGVVYSDANNNGVDDAGELPISGVTLTITGSNDLGAIKPIIVTTAADGSYSFGNLRPGTYTVAETQPSKYLDGLDAQAGVVIAGSNATDVISSITVAAGINSVNNNFGDLLPANAGGFVYVDANNNGIKDNGETGISGVTMTLTGSNDMGVITPITVTTGSDGSYSFGTLRPGDYAITEAQPAKYLDGLDASGGTIIAGSNTTDTISNITLGAGVSSSSDNFGDLLPACAKGFVYVDSNNNGIKDSGEAAISGVIMTLTGSNDFGTITPITVTTAADGSYSFGNLRPGTYTISENQPAGYFDGLDAKAGSVISGSNTSDAITGLTLASFSNSANNNFGELLAGSASGFVYADANNNGVKDSGETPIGGVVLTLSGSNDLGTIAPITVTTATDGSYIFGHLRPGTYTISETQPVGYSDGLDSKNGVVISGSNSSDAITGLTLGSGVNSTNDSFGELRPGIKIVTLTNGTNNDSAPVSGVTDGPSILGGSPVSWTYQVTDTGIDPIANVVVTDNKGTPSNTGDDIHPTYTSGDTNGNGLLDLGETWIFTASATAIVGQYENFGSVTGTASASHVAVTDKNVDHYFGTAAPTLNIVKHASDDFIAPGCPETFTYTVTTTGTVPVSNVSVIDDNATPSNTADDFHPTYVSGDANHNGLLDPSETWIYTATTIAPAPENTSATSSIASDFDCGSSFKAGSVIWFSSVFNPAGKPNNGDTYNFSGSTIKLVNGSTTYTIPVPNAIVTYSSSVTTATTIFDSSRNAWVTTLPTSFSGDVFMTAIPYVVPVNFTNVKSVTWNIKSSTPGSFSWQWAAAAYTQMTTTNYNAIGVKAIDGSQSNGYKNSDNAGTPENYKSYLTAGARGNGCCDYNYTGSYTCSTTVCPPAPPQQYLTNIATATGKASLGLSSVSLSATASATIDVISGLGNNSDCSVKACNFCISGNTVSFTLTNTGYSSQSLSELNMIWPKANGNLLKVAAGATSIFGTSTAAPDVDITSFLGTSSARSLGAGKSITWTFTFAAPVDSRQSDYGFLITMNGGTVLL